jgi:GNAT superfamily N-acetyltransferase
MDQTTINPRLATRDDIDGIAAAMARAFVDYPAMTYLIPDPKTRAERLPEYFALFLDKVWPGEYGEIRTTDGYAGASLWASPGHWKLPTKSVLRMVPGMLRIAGLRSLMRAMKVLNAAEKLHPKEPHWYLELLGTDPPMQRKGVGAALMQEVLDRCDREGLPAYLETQTFDNVAYYRHHGFEVRDEKTFGKGDDSVTFWFMWREPR